MVKKNVKNDFTIQKSHPKKKSQFVLEVTELKSVRRVTSKRKTKAHPSAKRVPNPNAPRQCPNESDQALPASKSKAPRN